MPAARILAHGGTVAIYLACGVRSGTEGRNRALGEMPVSSTGRDVGIEHWERCRYRALGEMSVSSTGRDVGIEHRETYRYRAATKIRPPPRREGSPPPWRTALRGWHEPCRIRPLTRQGPIRSLVSSASPPVQRIPRTLTLVCLLGRSPSLARSLGPIVVQDGSLHFLSPSAPRSRGGSSTNCVRKQLATVSGGGPKNEEWVSFFFSSFFFPLFSSSFPILDARVDWLISPSAQKRKSEPQRRRERGPARYRTERSAARAVERAYSYVLAAARSAASAPPWDGGEARWSRLTMDQLGE